MATDLGNNDEDSESIKDELDNIRVKVLEEDEENHENTSKPVSVKEKIDEYTEENSYAVAVSLENLEDEDGSINPEIVREVYSLMEAAIDNSEVEKIYGDEDFKTVGFNGTRFEFKKAYNKLSEESDVDTSVEDHLVFDYTFSKAEDVSYEF